MPRRSRLALIAGLALAGCLCGQAAPLPAVPELSRMVWQGEGPWFGGFSGLVVSRDGATFTAVTDRGWMTRGQFTRNAAGRITAVSNRPLRKLRNKAGKPLVGYLSDAEDLARAADGSLYVSFEGWTRVSRYMTPASPAIHLPRPPAFNTINNNQSLESVAISPDGLIWAIPEDIPGDAFPMYRFVAGTWSAPFVLPRRGGFLPVSADFGPDGRLYLLERGVMVPYGFATRLRRFDWDARAGPSGETVLFTTAPGTWGNMESVSIWRGPAGLVATLLSDDNFLPVLPTQFVEVALPD